MTIELDESNGEDLPEEFNPLDDPNFLLIKEAYDKGDICRIVYEILSEDGDEVADFLVGHIIELMKNGLILLVFNYLDEKDKKNGDIFPSKISIYYSDILQVETPYISTSDDILKKIQQHTETIIDCKIQVKPEDVQHFNNDIFREAYQYRPLTAFDNEEDDIELEFYNDEEISEEENNEKMAKIKQDSDNLKATKFSSQIKEVETPLCCTVEENISKFQVIKLKLLRFINNIKKELILLFK